ncbi:GGDEF domain-containing protein [Massilia alkalitolerans]|uniref:GGDEF domain-containing protein n=1 Tax=Massilia alkalitolerans TaxID=286638 RepID=UPI0004806DBB|nr:GGDEF domain-containing protein [Massilia alkalitolerans]
MDQIATYGAYRTAPLHELELFQGETDPAVGEMVADCAIVRVLAGKPVEHEGRARIYIVLAGELEVAASANAGGGVSSTVLPGECVGEHAVLDGAAELATMTAVQDSELLVIESDTVWALIERSHLVSRNLLRLLSFRIRAANAMLQRRQKLGDFYRQLSLNDALTGLYNRAWLNEMLPKLASRAMEQGSALSLLMIDLDHFKRFNDTHGHPAGDAALAAAAGAIRSALRPTDFAVRYGGEEMMVLLPHTTQEQALSVAGRLCECLRTAAVFDDMRLPLPHITGSLGLASLGPDGNERALMDAADAALYRAKEQGRNRVCT